MTIANTDKFLVNRSGSSYHVEAQSFDDVQPTDILLVNRAGKSYKCTRANLDAKLLDDDILLINRGNQSYKVTGAEFKTLLTVLPKIASVTLTELTPGNSLRWTDQQYRWDCVMAEDGDPASTRRITYYIEGKFAQKLITDTITGWDAGSKTLTFASDKDLTLFESGDIIRQDVTTIEGGWRSFPLTSEAGTYSRDIATNDTTAFALINKDKTPDPSELKLLTGPVTLEGPWVETPIATYAYSERIKYIDNMLFVPGSGTDVFVPMLWMSTDFVNFTEINTGLSPEEGRINCIEYFQGRWYIGTNRGLHYSDSFKGPWTKINVSGLAGYYVTDMAITPWGMYLAVFYEYTTAPGASNPTHIYILDNDGLTLERKHIGQIANFKTAMYRDGVVMVSGRNPSGGSMTFAWSTDGSTFETASVTTPQQHSGITHTGKFSHLPNEFDPVTRTDTSTGITVSSSINGHTIDPGLLIHVASKDENWAEGTLVPIGIVSSVDVANRTVTLSSTTGDWSANSGNYGIGNVKYLTAKRHLKFSGNDVVDFWPDGWDPALITTDLTRTITFPSVFPSGRTPDEEIAPGAELFVCVEAYNSAGTDGPVCDSVQPAGTRSSMEYDAFRELLLSFETYEYRTAVAQGETPPDRDQLIADLQAKGYELPEITSMIGEEEDTSNDSSY